LDRVEVELREQGERILQQTLIRREPWRRLRNGAARWPSGFGFARHQLGESRRDGSWSILDVPENPESAGGPPEQLEQSVIANRLGSRRVNERALAQVQRPLDRAV